MFFETLCEPCWKHWVNRCRSAGESEADGCGADAPAAGAPEGLFDMGTGIAGNQMTIGGMIAGTGWLAPAMPLAGYAAVFGTDVPAE